MCIRDRAATARSYRKLLDQKQWVPSLGLSRESREIHAIFVPEAHIDIEVEADRLKKVMDEVGNVNIFLSEGAGVSEIVEQLEEAGETVPRDPFGHVQLDKINPGQWFAKQFAARIGAEKVMVQKSGYFSRASAAGEEDLRLIKSMTDYAVECAFAGKAGLIAVSYTHLDVYKRQAKNKLKKQLPTKLPSPKRPLKKCNPC